MTGFNILLTAAAPNQIADIWQIIKNITFVDVVDIAFVSVLLYYLYIFIRERRAV